MIYSEAPFGIYEADYDFSTNTYLLGTKIYEQMMITDKVIKYEPMVSKTKEKISILNGSLNIIDMGYVSKFTIQSIRPDEELYEFYRGLINTQIIFRPHMDIGVTINCTVKDVYRGYRKDLYNKDIVTVILEGNEKSLRPLIIANQWDGDMIVFEED